MQNCYKFEADMNVSFGYLLYVPDDYDPKTESLPLIVFLHGAGERGNGTTQLDRVKIHGIPKLIDKGLRVRALVLCPQCEDDKVWDTQVYGLKKLIDKVVMEYNADKSKISITGLSMGGYGTWMMGITFPDMFYKMAPVCGGGFAWLSCLIKIPVRAFHGTNDTVVPFEASRVMVDRCNDSGGNAQLTAYEGVGHDSWVNAYERSDLIVWLLQ